MMQKTHNGFTVLELVVASTIATVIIVVGYAAFGTGTIACSKGRAASNHLGEPLTLLRQMRTEMGACFLSDPITDIQTGLVLPPAQPEWQLVDHVIDGRPADLLNFQTSAGGKVSYFIYSNGERRGLVRRDANGTHQWISDNIIGLDIRGSDGDRWLDQWNSYENQLPLVVEITLHRRHEEGEIETFSQTVQVRCKANEWVDG